MKQGISALAGLLMLCATVMFAQEPVGIFKAAYDGDLAKVKEFVEAGTSVMTMDGVLSTPLHLAADGGQEEVATYLILHGADVNVVNNDGFTPLHSCALHGDSATAALLITHGATVFARDNNQMTPLHLCGLNDNVGVAKVLVANGADINDLTATQWTPLRVAQYGKAEKMQSWLMMMGAKQ